MNTEISQPIGVPSPNPKAPSLAPKEHGAYGQISMPLLSALCAHTPNWASLLLTIGAFSVFFAHEPLLILIGHRGNKAKRELSARARKRFFLLGLIAALTSVPGLWLSPHEARLGMLAPALGMFALTPFIFAKQEKTLAGESLAAAALSFCAFPVALASKLPLSHALAICVSFSLAFAAATWAVRSVIQHHKSPTSIIARSWPICLHTALLILFPALRVLPWFSAYCALPMLLFSLALVLRPPAPTSLRTVGFRLVFCSVLQALFLILFIRG